MRRALITRVVAEIASSSDILHKAEKCGTVAVVERKENGEVWYHAREFTRDSNGVWDDCGGYSTMDQRCYMGQRYKDPELWGAYFADVF